MIKYYTMYNRILLKYNLLDDWRNVVKHLLIVRNIKRTNILIAKNLKTNLYGDDDGNKETSSKEEN